jgi:3-oxoacyl-[acyl-carrier-protein] synthase-1
MSTPVAITSTGLVTSVGLSSAAACAAMRAKLSNPSETRFVDSGGEWILAHQVPLAEPLRGRARLARMAALAASECLARVPPAEWQKIPLILSVAERERPGRIAGLDVELFGEIEQELDTTFAPEHSLVVPHGRVSMGVSLQHARRLIDEQGVSHVLLVATDSLVVGPTLGAYEQQRRLLTAANSNGFMPGEGAAALLVSRATGGPQLLCTGIGFAMEPAHIDSEQPLRADGLSKAIRAALQDARCEMHQLDFRITDNSGEQYYFKEAALALSRLLRVRKDEFDIWHPAECIGEAGAVAGFASLVLADAACRKGYAPGEHILCHAANDAGQRTAAIVRFSGH